jgi:hypothetical protein
MMGDRPPTRPRPVDSCVCALCVKYGEKRKICGGFLFLAVLRAFPAPITTVLVISGGPTQTSDPEALSANGFARFWRQYVEAVSISLISLFLPLLIAISYASRYVLFQC